MRQKKFVKLVSRLANKYCLSTYDRERLMAGVMWVGFVVGFTHREISQLYSLRG